MRVRSWHDAGMMALVTAALVGVLLFQAPSGFTQVERVRLVKIRVPATYPDLARRSNISGVVKLRVVVAPNGQIKDSTVIGGNAVLAKSAIDAVQQWKFEPANEETTEVVEFKFAP